MTSTSSAGEDGAKPGLELKILSQLPGPDGTLLLNAVDAQSTVSELKVKIRDDLSSHPPTDRLRLIYWGRLLRDADVLHDFLPKDEYGTHNLHLVVRDTQTSGNARYSHQLPLPTSSTGPPTAEARSQAPVSVAPGSSTGLSTQLPMALGTPNQAYATHAAPHYVTHPTNAGRHFDPQIVHPQSPFPGIDSPNAQAHAHAQQPLPSVHIGQPPDMAAMIQMQMRHANHMMAAAMQQQMMMQQGQAGRAAVPALQTGLPPAFGLNNATNTAPTQPQSSGAEGQPNIVRRQWTGPNGETMAVTSTTTTTNAPPAATHLFPQDMPSRTPPSRVNTVQTRSDPFRPQGPRTTPSLGDGQSSGSSQVIPYDMPGWPCMPPIGVGQEYYGIAHAIDSMRKYQQELEAIRNRLRTHRASDNENQSQIAAAFKSRAQSLLRIRNRAQRLLNGLILPGGYAYHAGLSAEEVRILQSLNDAFSSLYSDVLIKLHELSRARSPANDENRTTLNDQTGGSSASASTPVAESQSADARSGTNEPSTDHTQSVTAYLLQSSSGPRAVVFSPQGTFQSQRNIQVSEQQRAHASFQPPQQQSGTAAHASPTANNTANNTGHPPPTALAHRTNDNPAANQNGAAVNPQAAAQPPVQAQAHNEANELMNIMAQGFQHLWLLIRVFGFIWLVTRGATTRRTLLLGIVALIYLGAQAGFFGDSWDRLRRHFENLLGLPLPGEGAQQNPRPNVAAGQQPANANANAPRPANATTPTPAPGANRSNTLNPRATADRLLQARQEQDQSWLRQRLTTVERAVALFVASLYPGVGERHVQARERAVAEQRRLDDETEVRRRAQEEEAAARMGAEHASPSASGGADGASGVAKDVESVGGGERVAADTDAGEGSSSGVQPIQ